MHTMVKKSVILLAETLEISILLVILITIGSLETGQSRFENSLI
jgi:hypothetical protein